MKKIYALVMACFFVATLWAQTGKTQIDAIEKCIKSGNSTELSSYFANTVECDLLSEEGMYSKAQATIVVKRFFEKQVPKTFSFKHSSDKQSVKYAIGTLQTQAGDTLRVTVFYKVDSETVKIQQLRIEKE